MAKETFIDSFRIISPESEQIDIKLFTKSTRTYNYEYAEASSGLTFMGRGEYRYLNRPWQSYDFDIALRNLCRALAGKDQELYEFYRKQCDEWAHKDAERYEAWFQSFKKDWDENVSDDIKERTARALKGHSVSSIEEAEQIKNIAKVFSIMQSMTKGE